jgi:hypothetical protein
MQPFAVRLAASVLALAAAAQARAAVPAAPSPTAVAPVTVQGAAPPKTIEKQARSFVETHAAPVAKINQIGRWHEPICVQVVNLIPEQVAKVRARVEDVARAVGLKVMKPGCRSNIQIVVTGQPQALIDKVAQRDEHDLGFHWRADLDKVKAVTHPIQAWYKTATQGNGNANGLAFAFLTMPGPSGAPGMTSGDDPQFNAVNTGSLLGETHAQETVDIPENGSPSGCADSHFSGCLKSLFKNVLIVVDSHAVEGRDLGATADYLAMLALSRQQSLDGCDALSSIIDLYAKSPCPGRDPPDGLTAADASYLTALYASDSEGRLSSEQGDIAGRMAKILIKAQVASR